jgi:hypothetical protein
LISTSERRKLFIS